MLSNYHTHSRYCDGKGEPHEYVEFALANGFSALGFSGHAPLPFNNTFSIHNEDYLAYCNEVRALKEEYRGQGIGGCLLDTAISWLRENGIDNIFLESGKENHNAHEFFKSKGFGKISEVYKLR